MTPRGHCPLCTYLLKALLFWRKATIQIYHPCSVCTSPQHQLLDHIFHLLGDKDVRVRSAVAAALCTYLSSQAAAKTNGFATATLPNTTAKVHASTTATTTKSMLFKEFVGERVFNDLPRPLSRVLDSAAAAANDHTTINNAGELDDCLAKVLFHLANVALELPGDKSQQVSGQRVI